VHVSRLLIIGTTATLAVGLSAAPAVAAPTDDTVVTFTIVGGTLDILSAATANLGNGNQANTFGGQLGAVAVSDTRAAATASWTATTTSTDFETGAGGTGEVIAATEVDYWSGAATAGPAGSGTFAPGQANAAAAAALDNDDDLTAFTHTGGTGNNSVSWNPTLIITAGAANVVGIYTGTVTHSVG
jgi:hypothetical protein